MTIALPAKTPSPTPLLSSGSTDIPKLPIDKHAPPPQSSSPPSTAKPTHACPTSIISPSSSSASSPLTNTTPASSPCSPTSTAHLATPEWASPDTSCRFYLSRIAAAKSCYPPEKTLRAKSLSTSALACSDVNTTCLSSPALALTKSQPQESMPVAKKRSLWSKRSLSMSLASSPSNRKKEEKQSQPLAVSFGTFSETFGVKKQRKQDSSLEESVDEDAGNEDDSHKNTFCSECNAYRAFVCKTGDPEYQECEECHSLSRRRSCQGQVSTFYISFPSLDGHHHNGNNYNYNNGSNDENADGVPRGSVSDDKSLTRSLYGIADRNGNLASRVLT